MKDRLLDALLEIWKDLPTTDKAEVVGFALYLQTLRDQEKED